MDAFMRRESSQALVIARPRGRARLATGSRAPTVRVDEGRTVWGACAWLVVASIVVLLTTWAIPSPAAPLPPGLQSILNTATGASAPPASAPQAASTPMPASQAELARSLNNLIATLDNDTQRKALVTQLEGLRDAAQNAAPAARAQANSDLLGAIASGIASVGTNINESRTLLHFWAARSSAAADELRTILRGGAGEPFGQALIGMTTTLAGWGACAGLLIYIQRRICTRYGWEVDLAPNPTLVNLLTFALRRAGPWVVAFVAVLLFVRATPDALGRTLGLVIAYSIVAGSAFSAICMIVFSVFSTAHRRVAVQQLLARTLWPLFAIGACGALGDATANAKVTQLLGLNLAGIVSTLANMAAAILSGYFALAYRRPVTHLIRNRPYARRRDHKFATEALDIFASLWHIPILLIAVASAVAIIDGRGAERDVLQSSVLSALSSSRNKALNPGVRARTMLPLVRNAIFVTVVSLAAIIAAANLGINLTPLLAGAGIIGLAVGFGAKSLVMDLITGLFIIVEETISVGDWIDVDGGHAGTVMDLTIRTVRLRDGQGAVHTIPFSQIKIVKNLSRDFANAVFEARVPFSADMNEVTRMIVEVGAELLEDSRFRNEILWPVEVWGLERFDANWMVVKGQIKTRPLQHWSVARAFNAQFKLKMDEAGIDIPLPQMQLHTSPKERNLWPQTDDLAQGEDRQAMDASSATRRRPGMAVAPELHVLKEPLLTEPPVGQSASTSPAGSGNDSIR